MYVSMSLLIFPWFSENQFSVIFLSSGHAGTTYTPYLTRKMYNSPMGKESVRMTSNARAQWPASADAKHKLQKVNGVIDYCPLKNSGKFE